MISCSKYLPLNSSSIVLCFAMLVNFTEALDLRMSEIRSAHYA
jgi:hypothetical protein